MKQDAIHERARAQSPYATPQRVNRIDTLRAFAMTAVVAQHCGLLPFGWMGVWLFFVISGFVVTTSLLDRPAERGWSMLYPFYARRAARISPIYLGYVTIGFIVSGLVVGHLQWPPFASLVLLYNNFQMAFAHGEFKGFPVSHLWTISVEFQFYIAFGLAFALLPRRGLIAALVVFLALSPMLRFMSGIWLVDAGFRPLTAAFAIYAVSPLHFDSFAAGALLALSRSCWSRPKIALWLLGFGLVAMTSYVSVYMLVNSAEGVRGVGILKNVISGILFGDLRQVWVYSAVAALSTGILATAVVGPLPWTSLLNNPALQSVGRISYGGYIYHGICTHLSGRLLGEVLEHGRGVAGKLEFGVIHFVMALVATLALASLSYRYIEQPIIRWAGIRLKRSPSALAAS